MNPTAIEEVTDDWLRSALASDPGWEGYHLDGEAEELTVGFAGSTHRATLTSSAEPGQPRTAILKFSSKDEANRRRIGSYGYYSSEVGFYRDLAPGAGIAVPRAYFAEYDPATDHHVLVLEDLVASGYQFGSDTTGCSLEQGQQIVRALARMHAHWMGRDQLKELPWLLSPGELVRMRATSLREVWSRFPEWLREQLDSYAIATLDALMPRLERAFDDMDGPFATLTHGDFRLDNLCFNPPGEVLAFDWQVVARGNGTRDLAYFASAVREDGLAPDDAWHSLAATYHDELVQRGVEGYSLEAVVDDSRLSFIHTCQLVVSALGSHDLTSSRRQEIAVVAMTAITDWATRFELLDLLKQRYPD